MIIDIVVIAAILISALIAFLRGFIREVLTIIGVVGGSLSAAFGGGPLAGLLKGWLSIDEHSKEKLFDLIPYGLVVEAASYGTIFVLVVVLLSVASHYLAKGASSVGLGPIDRTLGVAFGVLRAVVLLGLLYMPVHLLVEDEARQEWFKGSRTQFYLEWTAQVLEGLLPEGFDAKKSGEKAAEQTRDQLEKLDLLGTMPGAQEGDAGKDSGESGEAAGEDKGKPEGEGTSPPGGGYEGEQRRKLDQLFEDQTKGGQQGDRQ